MGLAFSYADLNTGCDPFGVGNARSPLTPFGLYAVTPLGVITHVDPGPTPKGPPPGGQGHSMLNGDVITELRPRRARLPEGGVAAGVLPNFPGHQWFDTQDRPRGARRSFRRAIRGTGCVAGPTEPVRRRSHPERGHPDRLVVSVELVFCEAAVMAGRAEATRQGPAPGRALLSKVHRERLTR